MKTKLHKIKEEIFRQAKHLFFNSLAQNTGRSTSDCCFERVIWWSLNNDRHQTDLIMRETTQILLADRKCDEGVNIDIMDSQ